MSFTPAQQEAITARGNVLMVAGAGTGKTTTLVERCLYCLLEEKPPAALDEILMVTFTEATATDMRKKIRTALEKRVKAAETHMRDGASHADITHKLHANHLWLAEQLALFEDAHIGTLHSFCFELVKQHFYELELDPQLTVLPEEEAKLLADETLENIFQKNYAGETSDTEAVQQLVQSHGRAGDKPIRALVLRLHNYAQTLRDPEGWFAAQFAMFESVEPTKWREWLIEGVASWRDRWLPALLSQSSENLKAAECAVILKQLPASPSREQIAATLEKIQLTDRDWPRGKKTVWRAPLIGFFKDAVFLRSLARVKDGMDPLAQDWEWCRGPMKTLLALAQSFTAAFSDAKRELGAVDFHDLEQHSLRLLWDHATGQPTATARAWRKKLRFVFVDEYQDINDAQDAILKALSREGQDANRFLVGDVKQSIYRFRLADPSIFRDYAETWHGEAGRAIPLVDNFRSRESILKFVNSLFVTVMRREIGGVPYDENARLKFGDPENRIALSLGSNVSARVELHLRLKGAGENTDSEEGDAESARAWAEVANLEEAAKEARLAALRLRELQAEGHLVWDEPTKAMRPVEWRDMAVLLRSPSGKAESYAREFARLGVPLTVARCGFYESLEITDLLALLQLLDNPLQDLPALAVLHSPLVGMSLDELAAIRLQVPRGHCWTALQRFHETSRDHAGWTKADRFLKNFMVWRKLARQVSLSRCLEAVLGETHYADWLLTQPRGEQRHANVRRLLALAQQFDHFQRQGLFRFLHFIEAQQAAETEPQVAAVAGDNAVALMSIHQSKGLEFPVVVVADLGKGFNLSDLRAEIILDSRYGLCPRVKPPHTGQRYPSLPVWLATQHHTQETLGEELRLLYVAMTRAKDTLILTGTLTEKKFLSQWNQPAEPTTASLLGAKTYLDWIAAWSGRSPANSVVISDDKKEGQNEFLSWRVYDDLDQRLYDGSSGVAPLPEASAPSDADAGSLRRLRERLEWQYPHIAATRESAKTSVTAVRRRIAEEAEQAEEAAPRFKFQAPRFKSASAERISARGLSAEKVGLAHHLFQQLVSLKEVGTLAGLKLEARRMELEGALTAEETASLNLNALAEFWQSELGTEIRAKAECVHRELEFTARFSPEELAIAEPPAGEFVVVQGAADLAVMLPKEIWLVDFKTDRMTAADVAEKVKLYEPQLRIYALALSRIYRRPVTQAHLHFLVLGRSEKIDL